MSDISINFLSRASDVSDPLGGEIASKSPYTKEEERFVAVTHVDWKETWDAHVFKADLPGVKKEAVKLGVIDGRILEISADGSKEELKVWEGERYHRSERPQIRFLRRFRLPENAKVDEAKAVMDNGLLTVTVPKRPQPKPQFKAIEISG